MFTSFEELSQSVKNKYSIKGASVRMGRELAADIVRELKTGTVSPELRKELNKERIKALGMYSVQGGKA